MAITLETLDKKYAKAKREYEEARISLAEKENVLKEITDTRNKRMCKILLEVFNHFYYCMRNNELYFEAFEALDKLGADSSEVLYQEFDEVFISNVVDSFIVRQNKCVNYEYFTHDVMIPIETEFQKIEEILEGYIKKEQELHQAEEEKEKQKRYENYLRLKEEFEGGD